MQQERRGEPLREYPSVRHIERVHGVRWAELVGFRSRHSRHPVLGSVGAYDVAYWKLFDSVTETLEGAPAY